MSKIRDFVAYKRVGLLLLAWWTTVLVLCGLGVLLDMENLIFGFVAAIVATPLVFWKVRDYRQKSEGAGRELFFSKGGYITAGVSLGLLTLSVIFNVTYQPGWFDFRDFFFYAFSLPLSGLVKFRPNVDMWSSRLLLYLITIVNLALVTWVTDVIVLALVKTYAAVRKKVSG